MGTDSISAGEFEALYRSTVNDVFGYVRRRAAADAEDLVSEVYAIAWGRRADLPPRLLHRAWLFGVARTLLLADARGRSSEAEATAAMARDGMPTPAPTGHSEAQQVVARAIARLTPAEREILRLVEWERLTPAELGVALGVRPGTARVRLHRARQALARDTELRAFVDASDVVNQDCSSSTPKVARVSEC